MPTRLANIVLAAAMTLAAFFALSATSYAATSSSSAGGASASGGTAPASSGQPSGGVSPQDQMPATGKAKIINGYAYAPADAPQEVKDAINAANTITGLPYKYGGGHKLGFTDNGYDCS